MANKGAAAYRLPVVEGYKYLSSLCDDGLLGVRKIVEV
jgi:hypothetical protein